VELFPQDQRAKVSTAASSKAAASGLFAGEEQWEYVLSLGLAKVPGEEHVVRFLSDSLNSAPLPSPWTMHRDSAGRLFYGNANTGETSWKHPLEDVLKELAGMCRVCISLTRDLREPCIANLKEQWEASAKDEFSQWYAVDDPESGMSYYCNSYTGETMWEHPAEVLLPGHYLKLKAADRLLDDDYLHNMLGAGATQGSTSSVWQRTFMNSTDTSVNSTFQAVKNKEHGVMKERLAETTIELENEKARGEQVRRDFAALVDKHEEAMRIAEEAERMRQDMEDQLRIERERAEQAAKDFEALKQASATAASTLSQTLQDNAATKARLEALEKRLLKGDGASAIETAEEIAAKALFAHAAGAESSIEEKAATLKELAVQDVLSHIAKAAEEFQKLRDDADKARSDCTKIEKLHEEKDQLALTATAQLDERQAKLGTLEEELAQIHSSLADETANLSQTQARLNIVEAELLVTRSTLVEQESLRSEAEAKLQRLRQHQEEQANNMVEASPEMLSNLRSQLAFAKDELESERQRAAQASAEVQELVHTRSQAEQYYRDAVDAKARVEELELQLQEAQSSLQHEETTLLLDQAEASYEFGSSATTSREVLQPGMGSMEDFSKDASERHGYASTDYDEASIDLLSELAKASAELETEKLRAEEAREEATALAEKHKKAEEDAGDALKKLRLTEERLLAVERDLAEKASLMSTMNSQPSELREQVARMESALRTERDNADKARQISDQLKVSHDEAVEKSISAIAEKESAEERLVEAQKALKEIQDTRPKPLETVEELMELATFDEEDRYPEEATGGTGSATNKARNRPLSPKLSAEVATQRKELMESYEKAMKEQEAAEMAIAAAEARVAKLEAELLEKLQIAETEASEKAKLQKHLEAAERLHLEQKTSLELERSRLEERLGVARANSEAFEAELRRTAQDLLASKEAEEGLNRTVTKSKEELEAERQRVEKIQSEAEAALRLQEEAVGLADKSIIEKQALEVKLQDISRQLHQTEDALNAGGDERVASLHHALQEEKEQREILMKEQLELQQGKQTLQRQLEHAEAAWQEVQAKLQEEHLRVDSVEAERKDLEARHAAAMAAAAAADEALSKQLKAAVEAEAELTSRATTAKEQLDREKARVDVIEAQREVLEQEHQAALLRMKDVEASQDFLQTRLEEVTTEMQKQESELSKALETEKKERKQLAKLKLASEEKLSEIETELQRTKSSALQDTEKLAQTEARLVEVEQELYLERSRPSSPVMGEYEQQAMILGSVTVLELQKQLEEAARQSEELKKQMAKTSEHLADAREAAVDAQLRLSLTQAELERERVRAEEVDNKRRIASATKREAFDAKAALQTELHKTAAELEASKQAEEALQNRAITVQAKLEEEQQKVAAAEASRLALTSSRQAAEQRARDSEAAKHALEVRFQDLSKQLQGMEEALNAGDDEKGAALQAALHAEQDRLKVLRATEERLSAVESQLAEARYEQEAESTRRTQAEDRLAEAQAQLEEELLRPSSPAHTQLLSEQASAKAKLADTEKKLKETQQFVDTANELHAQKKEELEKKAAALKVQLAQMEDDLLRSRSTAHSEAVQRIEIEAQLAHVEEDLLKLRSTAKAEAELRVVTEAKLEEVKQELEMERSRPSTPAVPVDLIKREAEIEALLEQVQDELQQTRNRAESEAKLRQEAEARLVLLEEQLKERARPVPIEKPPEQVPEAPKREARLKSEPPQLEAPLKTAPPQTEAPLKSVGAHASDEAEDMEMVPEPTAVIEFSFQNMDYEAVQNDPSVRQGIVDKVKEGISAHTGVPHDKIEVALSAGSVVVSASIPCSDETAAKDVSTIASGGDLLGKINSLAKEVPGITKALGGKLDFGLGGLKTQAVEKLKPKPKPKSNIDKELAKVSAKNKGLQAEIAQTSSSLEKSRSPEKPTDSAKAEALARIDKVDEALQSSAPKALPRTEAGYPVAAPVPVASSALPSRRRPRRFKEFRGRTWAYKGDALIIGKQIKQTWIDSALARQQNKVLSDIVEAMERREASAQLVKSKDALLRYNGMLRTEAAQLQTQLDELASQRDSARALPKSTG